MCLKKKNNTGNSFKIKNKKGDSVLVSMNKVYNVKDCDMNIGTSKNGSHSVVLTSIDRKKGTCIVNTISSLERYNKINKNGKTILQGTGKLKKDYCSEINSGSIIPIRSKDINSKLLTGIYTEPLLIDIISLCNDSRNFKYPTAYEKVIRKK